MADVSEAVVDEPTPAPEPPPAPDQEPAPDATDADGVLLDVRDGTLRVGGVTALSGVTFDVRHDELFAIIGPNGAGKTSIFNCLSSVYRPRPGSITLDGRQLVGLRPTRTAE